MNPAAILLRATYAQDLTRLLVELVGLTGPLAVIRRVTIAGSICEVLAKLGASAPAAAPAPAPVAPLPRADDQTDDPATPYDPIGEARGARAALYSFDPNRKPAQRRRENAAAVALLQRINSGELPESEVTEEHRATLAKYSGNGGNLTDEDGKKGSPFEYYTPLPIAEGTWQLLREMGFSGGRALDPSAGTGIFGASAPRDAVVDAIELSPVSGAINQIVNGGPGYKCRTASFEEIAVREDDETYDAIITNVPFGGADKRGESALKDPRYQKETLEGYFILTGLRKLKPGGFAAFIVPERVVSGRDGAESRVRMAASRMADFRGAYRLPSSLFVTAGAEVITDIIVFQKHSKATREKVQELITEGRQDLLKLSKVLWDEFLDGRYFSGEGKRFVLGDFIPKNPDKVRDVNRVQSDKSPADVARLLTKFGPSRIDFAALDAAETLPITYNEGDTVQHDGQTLQLRAGEWVPIRGTATAFDESRVKAVGAYPMQAFNAGLSWGEVADYVALMRSNSRAEMIPDWMNGLWSDVSRLSPSDRETAWRAVLVGAAAEAAFEHHQRQEIGFDYTREYPALTAAMSATAADARAITVGGAGRTALQFARTHYSAKRGFSSTWRGDVAAGPVDDRGSDERFSAARYKRGSVFVPVEEARAIYGDDFDPMHDPTWCISPDGASVARADDVYVGNVGDLVGKMRQDAAATASQDVRDKMLAQIAEAHARADRIDVSKIEFNLFSPFVTMEEKADFLRRYYDEGFAVDFSDSGEKRISYTRTDSASDSVELARKKKLYRRMSLYLEHGTVTTGSAQVGDRKAALAELRRLTEEANEKFNIWTRSNDRIMGRLESQANDPNRLVFRKVKDSAAVPLPGWKLAEPPDGIIPHGYQYSFVRQQGRQFGGINGYAVGLGKAQPLNAKILSPSGWVRMGDIALGDEVIAGDGSITRVTGVFPQGVKEIFEVRFNDGATTRCCDEHLWFTSTESDRTKMRRAGMPISGCSIGAVKSLKDIRVTIRTTGGRLKNHSIPMVGAVQFREAQLPIHPYLLGVLLGDGSFSENSVNYSKPDKQIQARVAHLLKEGFGDLVELRQVGSDPINPTFSISRTSPAHRNPVVGAVRDLGLSGAHSHQRFIPDAYMTASIGQRIELLRGLMDTDGYASKLGDAIQFTSTARMLADQVRELVLSLGGNAKISSKIPTFTHKGERKNGRLAFTVTMRMPPAINPFLLERKAERAKPNTKYMPTRLIDAVVSVGHEDAQCIAVDHPSHLYVTDDYIVTHNTSTALAAALYVQSIGVKKKTVFAVPNSVLSNWYKEAGRCYDAATMARCLFVGMTVTEDGSPVVKSSDYDRDLNRIAENRHDKIFMSFEALGRLKMRDDTIREYIAYVSQHDASMAEAERKADDIKAEGKRAGLADDLTSGKPGGAPYVEDLGIDSLVLDEAHCAKNSSKATSFKKARFLSLSDTSDIGDWMQAVAWYIRGLSAKADGVLCLTATPITNSPLEIHAMLSLATGRDKVNDLMMGASGADQFLEMVCDVEMEEDESIDGIMRQTRVFKGLRNADVLRRALASVATIETPETVGMTIKLPDEEQCPMPVDLPPELAAKLQEYKGAFRWAIDFISGKEEPPDNRGDAAAYARVKAKFGEPIELIGHPFNMVRKMARLIVDPDLDEGGTIFYPGDDEVARRAIEQFNKLKLAEDRTRPGPLTLEEDVKTGKIKRANPDDDPEVKSYKITVRARFDITAAGRSRVVIDTMDGATQAKFEAIADKLKLELDVGVPPKLAALVENVSMERLTPRGVGAIVKQIIFCDELGMHRKIVRLLAKRCGVPSGKIAIITGKTNNRPEDIIDVQNGFNAHGEENRYEVIIANEKAEVGINLQQGTQAIHHLTIGWTPDSLTQRNGRGVRQGNKAEFVRVYSYDARGTFDMVKRSMVNRKADWIGEVMDANGSNRVAVSGGLTREQEIALIDSVGDPGAIDRHMAKQAEAEKAQRASSNRQRQTVGLDVILSNRKFLKSNAEPTAFGARLLLAARIADDVLQKLVKRRDTARKDDKPTDKLDVAIGSARAAYLKAVDEAMASFADMDEKRLRDVFGTIDRRVAKGERLGQTHAVSAVSIERLKLKEQCPARDDWSMQMDQARAILAESIKSFAGRANEDGGMPAYIAQAFADGEGDFLDGGRVVVKGALVRVADSGKAFAVAIDGEKMLMMSDYGWNTYTAEIVLKTGSVIELPGSPGFQALAVQIAAAEDAMAAKRPTSVGEKTIADYSPAVAVLRKVDTMQMLPANLYLPAPCLPRPIEKTVADRSRTGMEFYRLQSQHVTETSPGLFAFNPAKSGLVSASGRAGVSSRELLFCERAKSIGERIAPMMFRSIVPTISTPDMAALGCPIEAFRAAADAGEDPRDAAGQFLRDRLEFLDFAGNGDAYQWVSTMWTYREEVESIVRRRADQARRLAEEQARAEFDRLRAEQAASAPDQAPDQAPAQAPTPAPEVPAPVADTSGAFDISGMADAEPIGVCGNTKPWYQLIKQCQERHGGNARYVNESRGGPAWNMRVGGWKILIRDHPACVKDLTLCKAF